MNMKLKKTGAATLVVLLMGLMATSAHAGVTDTIFTDGVTMMTTLLTGTGGIMISLVAVVAAVVMGVSGNLKSALGALGVAILASVGPSIANAFFTAVL